MTENIKIIRNFISAWSNLDPDELVNYFTEDGIYYNMPIEPVQGKNNLKLFIQGFLNDWTKTEWEISNIICDGNTVFVERIDKTEVGDIKIDLPCCGIFEMEDGKIKIFLDYFDMNTYTGPLSKSK